MLGTSIVYQRWSGFVVLLRRLFLFKLRLRCLCRQNGVRNYNNPPWRTRQQPWHSNESNAKPRAYGTNALSPEATVALVVAALAAAEAFAEPGRLNVSRPYSSMPPSAKTRVPLAFGSVSRTRKCDTGCNTNTDKQETSRCSEESDNTSKTLEVTW